MAMATVVLPASATDPIASIATLAAIAAVPGGTTTRHPLTSTLSAAVGAGDPALSDHVSASVHAHVVVAQYFTFAVNARGATDSCDVARPSEVHATAKTIQTATT